MAITFDEIAALWKALDSPQRTAFTNAIKQIAADNKDEKSAGICSNTLVIFKRTAPKELIVILNKIIDDLNGNQAELKALLSDEIIKNDVKHFIGFITQLAEDNPDDPVDIEPPITEASLLVAPMRAGIRVTNSIGLEHLINRRFKQAFWCYFYEATYSGEVILDALGYTLIMARHDLFLEAYSIGALKAHKELLFKALFEYYNFQINKLDPKEIPATLEAYIDLLEKLYTNDFPLEDILNFISDLQKEKIPFGTLVNTYLDPEQCSQYDRWLQDLRRDHKQVEAVAQLRGDILASATATVIAPPALEKEMAAAQARTERLVESVDDEAADCLPPLAISSVAVSMAPSRNVSGPPSPKHGAFFATTNAPPISPKSTPTKQPNPLG